MTIKPIINPTPGIGKGKKFSGKYWFGINGVKMASILFINHHATASVIATGADSTNPVRKYDLIFF
jgi:hypothetical protein